MPKNNSTQDFIFSRSKKSARSFQEIETQIFSLLSKKLNINAKTITEFKRIARKNKRVFLKEVNRLVKDNKALLNQHLTFEINKMVNEGLEITDAEVLKVEKSAKSWEAEDVISRDKFINNNRSIINKAIKATSKDINVASSRMIKMLSNRYSHIVNNISMNVQDLKDSKLFRSNLRKTIIKQLNQFANQGLPSYITKDGKSLDLVNYSEMASRANFKRIFNQTQDLRYKEYKIDLVTTDTLADSSIICEPWQGGIYSQSGTSNLYEDISVPESAGHLTHIN